jgi:hypothetical protein
MLPIFLGLIQKDIVKANNLESAASSRLEVDGADYAEQKSDMKTINVYSVVRFFHPATSTSPTSSPLQPAPHAAPAVCCLPLLPGVRFPRLRRISTVCRRQRAANVPQVNRSERSPYPIRCNRHTLLPHHPGAHQGEFGQAHVQRR